MNRTAIELVFLVSLSVTVGCATYLPASLYTIGVVVGGYICGAMTYMLVFKNKEKNIG